LFAPHQEIIMRCRLLALALSLTTLGAAQSAWAGQEMLDIDPKWRSRIAKEKVKQGALERQAQSQSNRSGDSTNVQCGSQNIGNLNTGGRIGAAPREVFVFAPNAINVVNGRGCR
jgi:hypothetical protein